MSAKLEAGREMDAAVHRAVFGEEPRYVQPVWFVGVAELPRYSTHIAAAWLVVERLKEDRWGLNLNYRSDGDDYECEFDRDQGTHWDTHPSQFAPTAPEAICRAALAAVAPDARKAGAEE